MVRKVVLIDDDAEDLEFMFEAIKAANPEVECTVYSDPCEAVAALSQPHFIPELVIIDLTMPALSGIECLTQLKKLDYLDNVKFVMYSTAIPTKQILESLASYGVGSFQKPSSIKELDTIIHSLMV